MDWTRTVCRHVCLLLLWFSVNLANADVVPNMRLNGHVYLRFVNKGRKSCMDECFRRSACLSFNYDKVNFICLLNDADKTIDPGNFVKGNNFIYGEKADLDTAMTSSCRNVSCPEHQMCVVLHNFKPVCIRTGCGSPPAVNNAYGSKIRLEHPVALTNTYTCNAGYKLIGNAGITCKANGVWKTPTFECRDCGPPPIIRNTVRSYSVTTIGTNVGYNCNSLTVKIGVGHVVCQPDLTWLIYPFGCITPSSGCSADGYVHVSLNNLCYIVVNTPQTWHNAMDRCFLYNSQLIKLDTTTLISTIFPDLTIDVDYFIGGHNIGHWDHFSWIDQQHVANSPTLVYENHVMVIRRTSSSTYMFYSEKMNSHIRPYICGHIV